MLVEEDLVLLLLVLLLVLLIVLVRLFSVDLIRLMDVNGKSRANLVLHENAEGDKRAVEHWDQVLHLLLVVLA